MTQKGTEGRALMERCMIIGAGDLEGVRIEVRTGDYVIAADAGLSCC